WSTLPSGACTCGRAHPRMPSHLERPHTPGRVYIRRICTPAHRHPYVFTPRCTYARSRLHLSAFTLVCASLSATFLAGSSVPCWFQHPLLVPPSPAGSNIPCWFRCGTRLSVTGHSEHRTTGCSDPVTTSCRAGWADVGGSDRRVCCTRPRRSGRGR